jgi:hypothetical protein
LLEAACGGTITLFWVHLRGEVNRGFTLFTGACYIVMGALAIWLRSAFPPILEGDLAVDRLWFTAGRSATVVFVLLEAAYLLLLRSGRFPRATAIAGLLVPLLALASVWSAALVSPGPQLFGLGEPLAVLAGTLALGSALTGLSLGHWYLVSPSLSVRPLIRITFLCLGAIVAQLILLPILILTPGAPPSGVQQLETGYALFLGVRVVFGIVVPLMACVMTWRTARIRSLDSATGLLYIVSALILAGEIAARTLYFLTGVAT